MIIGTAGHVDHGKTALVRALTGVDADRLQEEKARGMTIDLGFAYLPMASGDVLGFVDVPGHEKFIHNMLAGATAIDFVLLVIAADDGVMPQTREHLSIVDLLGITTGAVALTKIDVVGAERKEEARAEVATLLEGASLADAPVFPVSSLSGEGVAGLKAFLLETAQKTRRKKAEGLFRLAVDRSFTRAGVGTIVTGAALSGVVKLGDQLLVSPSGLAARVRSIYAQNRPASEGKAGERCALNLVGDDITKESIHRGDVVVAPELHAPSMRFDATVRVLSSEKKALPTWAAVRLHLGAAEAGARIVPLEANELSPGDAGAAQLVLDRELALCAGVRFILRDVSAQRTLGGGLVLDPHPPARKRRTPERLRQLACLALEPPTRALEALLEQPPFFVDAAVFSRDHGLSTRQRDEAIEGLGLVALAASDGLIVMKPAHLQKLEDDALAAIDAHHLHEPDQAGLGIERLRTILVPRLPPWAFRRLLARLAERGLISTEGAWVRRPGHEIRLTEEDAARWTKIEPLLSGEGRFRPPRTRDIAQQLGLEETEVRRLLKAQSRRGALDEIAHDHFFLRATTNEIVEILGQVAQAAPRGEITAALLRDQLNNGRKVAIQILEFFDRHGVTHRRGDLRRLNKARLDLFKAAL